MITEMITIDLENEKLTLEQLEELLVMLDNFYADDPENEAKLYLQDMAKRHIAIAKAEREKENETWIREKIEQALNASGI